MVGGPSGSRKSLARRFCVRDDLDRQRGQAVNDFERGELHHDPTQHDEHRVLNSGPYRSLLDIRPIVVIWPGHRCRGHQLYAVLSDERGSGPVHADWLSRLLGSGLAGSHRPETGRAEGGARKEPASCGHNCHTAARADGHVPCGLDRHGAES